MPETVGDRLEKAQASGDPNQINAALDDAQAAGADPAQIEQAKAEVERLVAAKAEAAGDADKIAQAEAMKKKGNEMLKENTKSAAREAMEFFTTGLEVRCSDTKLNAQLHGNRAHVRLLLRQFVEAVDDCRKAIYLDPKNLKNYFRAAKASLNLDLCKNGIEFCEAGLRQNPQDTELVKMRSQCAEKLEGIVKRRAEMAVTHSKEDFNADEAMAVQEKVNQLNDQVESLQQTIMSKQREKMKMSLTLSSLADLPPDHGAYISVGRMFLKKDREYLDTSLEAMNKSIDEDLPRLTKTLQELAKRKEAAEQELKEMVKAFQVQSGGGGQPEQT